MAGAYVGPAGLFANWTYIPSLCSIMCTSLAPLCSAQSVTLGLEQHQHRPSIPAKRGSCNPTPSTSTLLMAPLPWRSARTPRQVRLTALMWLQVKKKRQLHASNSPSPWVEFLSHPQESTSCWHWQTPTSMTPRGPQLPRIWTPWSSSTLRQAWQPKMPLCPTGRFCLSDFNLVSHV